MESVKTSPKKCKIAMQGVSGPPYTSQNNCLELKCFLFDNKILYLNKCSLISTFESHKV